MYFTYNFSKILMDGSYKAFRHVETLFVQGIKLVPRRLAIDWRKVNNFCQPIAGLLGTRFIPWTNKVCTCRKALYRPLAAIGVQCAQLTH